MSAPLFGGCTSTLSANRAPAGTRTKRDFVNGVDYYNLDGFDLIWDGVPVPQ
jgi:hypothetical protein